MINFRKASGRFRHEHYVLAVLLFAYAVAFVDRQVIGLLVQPIKQDLGLSDVQFSTIAGFAFASFYTVVGLAMGHLADHWRRRHLILIGILVWVSATAAAGYAGTFMALLISRVFVAIGEATLNPAAYSMLADYFPPERRARAMSVYTSGVYLGSALAFGVGGFVMTATGDATAVSLPLLGSFAPWQATFILVALPGVLLFPLMLRVNEPVRREIGGGTPGEPVSAPDWLRHIVVHRRAYGPLMLGFSVIAIITYGFAIWLPATFIRTWGWTSGEFGLRYAAVILMFGVGGMLASGVMTDALMARGRYSASIRVALTATALLIPTTVLFALAAGPWVAMGAVALTTFFLGMPIALMPTILLSVTPNRLRGQITAMAMVLINFIGLGLGPHLIAWMTQYVFGDESQIRASLATVLVGSAVAGWLLLWAGMRPYERMIKLMDGAA